MYESNLTFEELEKYTISLSLNKYINNRKECHGCNVIKPLYLYACKDRYNRIYVRCEECSIRLSNPIIKLNKKDEIVYLLFIKNIIR